MGNNWIGFVLDLEYIDNLFNLSEKIKTILNKDFKRYNKDWLHSTFYFFGDKLNNKILEDIRKFFEEFSILLVPEKIENLNGSIILRFKKDKQLDRLHSKITNYLKNNKIEPHIDYIPHVTLGRLCVKNKKTVDYKFPKEFLDLDISNLELKLNSFIVQGVNIEKFKDIYL